MKNKNFPSGQDWDKIVDDAFHSNDVHTFSDNYLQRKASLQKGFVMKKNVKNPKHTLTATLAASVAVVIGVPAAIFAFNGTKRSVPSTDMSDVTEDTTVISTAECTTAAETTETITEPATEAMDYLTVDYTYLPEGFKRSVDCEQIFNSERGSRVQYFYFNSFDYKDYDGYQRELEESIYYEEYSVDDKEVCLLYRSDFDLAPNDSGRFGKIAYVDFKDNDFTAQMYITNDISDDDIKAIIEGMKIIPCSYDITQRWNYQGTGEEPTTQYCHVGDTIHNENNMAMYGEDVSITINSVKVQDNFDGIIDNVFEYTDLSQEYSEYIGPDGKLTDEYSYYEYNYTDDDYCEEKLIKTEKYTPNIITLDLTYNNLTDMDMCGDKDFLTCLCPSIYSNKNVESGENIHRENGFRGDAGSAIALYSENMSHKNHIDIPAHGSTNVKVSFLVDTDLFGDLYVTGFDFDNFILDLCDLKPAK